MLSLPAKLATCDGSEVSPPADIHTYDLLIRLDVQCSSVPKERLKVLRVGGSLEMKEKWTLSMILA